MKLHLWYHKGRVGAKGKEWHCVMPKGRHDHGVLTPNTRIPRGKAWACIWPQSKERWRLHTSNPVLLGKQTLSYSSMPGWACWLQSLAVWLAWLASRRHGMTCGSSQQAARVTTRMTLVSTLLCCSLSLKVTVNSLSVYQQIPAMGSKIWKTFCTSRLI